MSEPETISPHRSLQLKHETHNRPGYQPEAVINYPNEHAFTRITEFKYITGQEHPMMSIVTRIRSIARRITRKMQCLTDPHNPELNLINFEVRVLEKLARDVAAYAEQHGHDSLLTLSMLNALLLGARERQLRAVTQSNSRFGDIGP